MLFNNVVVNYLRFYAPGMADGTSWQVDAFAVSAVVICGVLSCCSLRVSIAIMLRIMFAGRLFDGTKPSGILEDPNKKIVSCGGARWLANGLFRRCRAKNMHIKRICAVESQQCRLRPTIILRVLHDQ